jgi:tryptophan-rich sensory protein
LIHDLDSIDSYTLTIHAPKETSITTTGFYCIAVISGISASATKISLEKPALFRPMAFQTSIGSLIWDLLAISGGISGLIFFIYGFIKFGIRVSFFAFIAFVVGGSVSYTLMRFGPLSPLCNAILAYNEIGLLF